MKIAIVGGEGTGRTTLASALAERLKLTLVPPIKDALLRQTGYHTLFEWAKARSWKEYVLQQLEGEQAAEAIVDGGALDAWCIFQRWGWNHLSPEQVEALHQRVLAGTSTYSHVIVLPPTVVAGHAPSRFRNASNNLQHTRLLAAILRETDLGKRTLTLLPENSEQRVAAALKYIGG